MRKEQNVNNKGGKVRSWWLKEQIKLIQTCWGEGKRDEQLEDQETQRLNNK